MNTFVVSLCVLLCIGYESCLFSSQHPQSLHDYAYTRSEIDWSPLVKKVVEKAITMIPHALIHDIILPYLRMPDRSRLEFGVMKPLKPSRRYMCHVTTQGRLITIERPGTWTSSPTLPDNERESLSVEIPLLKQHANSPFFSAAISDHGSSLASLATGDHILSAQPVVAVALDCSGKVLSQTNKFFLVFPRFAIFPDDETVIVSDRANNRLVKCALQNLDCPLCVQTFNDIEVLSITLLDRDTGILEMSPRGIRSAHNLKFATTTLKPIALMRTLDPFKDTCFNQLGAYATDMMHLVNNCFFSRYLVDLQNHRAASFAHLINADRTPIYCNKTPFAPTQLIIHPRLLMSDSIVCRRGEHYAYIDVLGNVYVGDARKKSLYKAFSRMPAQGITTADIELHDNGVIVSTNLGITVLNYGTSALDVQDPHPRHQQQLCERLYAKLLRSLLTQRLNRKK